MSHNIGLDITGMPGYNQDMTDDEKREKKRARDREYYARNKEKRKAYQAEYRKNNVEKIRERKARYQKNNKKKLQAYHTEYRKKNAEQLKQAKAKYYRANKEKIKARAKRYRQSHKEKIREYKKKYQSEYRRRPDNRPKIRARNILSNAIQHGKITRQPCEVCGAMPTEAHHDDYSKPLDVRWLCPKHHREIHRDPVENLDKKSLKKVLTK